MKRKRVKWPDVIELPDNWPLCRSKDGESKNFGARDARGPGMCVSMFLGKRLGMDGWENKGAMVAIHRMHALGFSEAQARVITANNDLREGTAAAIRKALELKGYEVPA